MRRMTGTGGGIGILRRAAARGAGVSEAIADFVALAIGELVSKRVWRHLRGPQKNEIRRPAFHRIA